MLRFKTDVSVQGRLLTRDGILGGEFSTENLDLYSNYANWADDNLSDRNFNDANTGRIIPHERISFSDSWTVTQPIVTFIDYSSTVTSALGGVIIFTGFNWHPTLRYNSALVFSACPAFSAGPTFQPTSAATDTISTLGGYFSAVTYSPDNAGVNTTPQITAYQAGVSITRANAAATVNVTSYRSFSSFGAFSFAATILNCTVTDFEHFSLSQPLTTSVTFTNVYGLRIGSMTTGSNIYGVHCNIAATAGRWFLYGVGTAQSAHTGNFRLGDTTAPTALLDIIGLTKFDTNGMMTTYEGLTLTGNGIAHQVATIDLTAQGAAIAATTMYAVPASGAGNYRVTWVATVTRTATTSSVLGGTNGFRVTYTDNDDSVVKTTPIPGAPSAGANQAYSQTNAANTTASTISGCYMAYAKASTNIQYAIDYTSVGATSMQFNLHITVERM